MLRYLSLKKPFVRIRKQRIKVILVVETVLSGMTGLITAIKETTIIIIQSVSSIIFLLTIFFLLLTNLLFYITLRANMKREVMAKWEKKDLRITQETTERNANYEYNNNKRKEGAVITLIIISVFYMLCHCLCVYLFVVSVSSLKADNNHCMSAYQVSTLLYFAVMLSNGFNAAIVILRSNDIIKFYKSIISH